MAESTNDQNKSFTIIFRKDKGSGRQKPWSFQEERYVESTPRNIGLAEDAETSNITYETMQDKYGKQTAKVWGELKRKNAAMFL